MSEPEPIHIISLGAGVQSTTLLLMSLYGDLPRVNDAIFADTQDEPHEVYEHLEKLNGECLKYGVKLHRVSIGRLSDEIRNHMLKYPGSPTRQYSSIPSFRPGYAPGQRRCTKFFKVLPIRRMARKLARGRAVVQWIGISLDEVWRMKPSGVKYITNRWPLIEKKMNRHDCQRWLTRHGWTASKSACCYCPFHNDKQWKALMLQPTEREKIIALDRFLNERGEFLHKTCKPLDTIDFSTEEERGQLNMFNNECEGMCGV